MLSTPEIVRRGRGAFVFAQDSRGDFVYLDRLEFLVVRIDRGHADLGVSFVGPDDKIWRGRVALSGGPFRARRLSASSRCRWDLFCETIPSDVDPRRVLRRLLVVRLFCLFRVHTNTQVDRLFVDTMHFHEYPPAASKLTDEKRSLRLRLSALERELIAAPETPDRSHWLHALRQASLSLRYPNTALLAARLPVDVERAYINAIVKDIRNESKQTTHLRSRSVRAKRSVQELSQGHQR